MANKTHKAPTTLKPTSFQLGEVAEKVLLNFNADMAGRKTENNPEAKRKPDSPVLFASGGRGANGYTMVSAAARAYGIERLPIDDVFTALSDKGYGPGWVDDADHKKGFRVKPIKGSTGVDPNAMLKKWGILPS